MNKVVKLAKRINLRRHFSTRQDDSWYVTHRSQIEHKGEWSVVIRQPDVDGKKKWSFKNIRLQEGETYFYCTCGLSKT